MGVYEVATFGIKHFGLTLRFFADTFEDGSHLYCKRAVVCQSIAFLIGVRAADGNLLYLIDIQRQCVICIFQQYDGLAGCLQGNGFIGRLFHFVISSGKVCLVGRVEQSDKELYPKDVAHTVVDDFFAQPAFLYEFAQRKHERVGRAECTTYVEACLHTLAYGLFHVFGGVVLGIEILHGIAVRHYISPETHFLAQAGCQPVVAALNGDTVVVVIGAHDTQ